MPIKISALAALLSFCGLAAADPVTLDTAAAEASASDLQRAIQAFAGIWSVNEKFPPSSAYPEGGTGHGTEVWREGPGNLNLVYEYHGTQPDGEISATAVFWWDPEARKLRELWCSSKSTKGCVLGTARIRWEGDELTLTDSYRVKERLVFSRQVWSDIHADRHTMTISESEQIGALKPWIISHATRISPP